MAVMSSFWAGCAGPEPELEPSLPYHLAVIPSLVEVREELPDEQLRLELDTTRVSAALTEALDQQPFTRATLLDYPPDEDRQAARRWSTEDWKAYWIRASARARADLLLECKLEYSTAVDSERNAKFWYGLPLFLLGGPGVYFVSDRTYSTDVLLKAWLYDLNPLTSGHAHFEDPGVLLFESECRSEPVDLTFKQRAETNAVSYLPTLLVPPGLLGGDDEQLVAELESRIAQGLARKLAANINAVADELRTSPRLGPYVLQPGLRVLREADNVHVVGEVVAHESQAQDMGLLRLRVGDRLFAAKFGEGQLDPLLGDAEQRYLRFPFHLSIPVLPGDQILRLELIESADRPQIRTFTHDIPPPQDSL